MNRRKFLQASLGTAGALATGLFHSPARLWGAAERTARDVVNLGPDKIKLSRLAIGLGTHGGNIQRELGLQGVADLLHFGYDQGLTFWDTADMYHTHPHVKEGLKSVPREKVVIMTKSRARTADAMRADLDRFRQEMGVDHIDIVLLHALRSGTWTEECKGAMDVLTEAREKGVIGTHGCSCHSLEALQLAAKTPWVRVDLARLNPAQLLMDADPQTVAGVLKEMKTAGKGVIGMKILGEGGLAHKVDESLRFAMSQDCLDCFTIGPANRKELEDLIQRIPVAAERLAEAAQAA